MEFNFLLVNLIVLIVVPAGILYLLFRISQAIIKKQEWIMHRKSTEIVLPLRLQAYERMCLFLERITPNNLVLRLAGSTESTLEFQQVLLRDIRQEYHHNLAQQLYLSTHAWELITKAQNEVTSLINQAAAEVSPEAPANDLARKIFEKVVEQDIQPTTHALKVLNDEFRRVFQSTP